MLDLREGHYRIHGTHKRAESSAHVSHDAVKNLVKKLSALNKTQAID